MRYLMMSVMAILLMTASAGARELASVEEGKIESKKNGHDKTYSYEDYTVVPKNATDAYRKKMARLEELEKENAELREQVKHVKTLVQEAPAPSKNTLSVLGGATTTGLKTETSPGVLKVGTGYEPDAGLLYSRDFDDFTGSAAATLRGNMYLGIGLKF